jgi:WD40 repeat protein
MGVAGVWLGDGRLIGASGGDGVVWRHDVLAGTWSEHDVRTGEATTSLADPPQMADVAAAATPGGRGLIAAISAEGAVYRLDAATGHSLGEPLPGHGEEGFAVAATTRPDGTVMIAATGDDAQIRRWDATTGLPIGTPLRAADWVMKLDFRALPDGRVLLVSTDQNGQVRRWDAVTGAPIGRPVEVGDGPVRTLVPEMIDPLNVIVASNDDRTRCWDATTAGHLGDIADSDCGSVAVDSGQIVVAAGHDDGSLEIIRWGLPGTAERE